MTEPSEQSQELFRLVVENVRDFAVYTKSLDGHVLSWNPGVERLLGYAEEDWVGRHISVIFTPEDLEQGGLDWELRTALEHGRAEVLLELLEGRVVLIVEDDGRGFEPGMAVVGERGMGLLSMSERAAQVGGTLEIESAPGKGTTVYARVPLAVPEERGGADGR